MRPRVAVVLFNLGGPDRPEAIKPFLVNLFTDPAILRVPFFVRPFLARAIARARLAPATRELCAAGRQVAVAGTDASNRRVALEAALPELDVKCFVAMRYWHPFSDETARAVRQWSPDEVVLLPLVSTVLHHHDRQLADGVARGCGIGRIDCADHRRFAAILPTAPMSPPRSRCWIAAGRRCDSQIDRECAAARAVLGSRPA